MPSDRPTASPTGANAPVRRHPGAVALAAATAVAVLAYPLLLLTLNVPAALVVAVTAGVFLVMFTAVRATLGLTSGGAEAVSPSSESGDVDGGM